MSAGAAARRGLSRLLGPTQPNESYIAYSVLRHSRGVMVDVGAHYGSSLAPFADAGWSIHAFEPDPQNRAELEAAYGDRPNVTIVPKAVSDEAGEMMLFTSAISSGVSSLAAFTPSHSASVSVPVITMTDYLSDAGVDAVDFMKIDVEGFEQNVLAGYDWTIPPTIIVLEFEDSKTIPLGYSWTDLADSLRERGYEILVSEWFPVEEYGGAHRWRRFARYPTQLVDANAWGNLIAAPNLENIIPAADRAVRRARWRRRIERLVRPDRHKSR